MIKTTMKIDGMMCGMCESHVNDDIRNHFSVSKVSSSHKTGMTEIISDEPLDEAKLRETVEAGGYKVISVNSEPHEKKGFSLFGKK